MDATVLFIHTCFLWFLPRLRGDVNKQFYIIEEGTEEDEAAPRTPSHKPVTGIRTVSR